ncbi:MAG: hypothetical protein ACRD9L_08155, partial [Bryobacteraceae bacterium]
MICRGLLALCLCTTAPICAAGTGKLEQDLDEIGRVATIMIDGDACQRIVTQRALDHIFHQDPRDQWAAGDNYDVNDEAFIQVKKTLIRLAHLAPYPVDVNLWMPLASKPPQIHIAIRNRYEMSQFWEWGK